MRVERADHVDAPPRGGLGAGHRPADIPRFVQAITRWEPEGDDETAGWARATGCACTSARPRSAALIEVVEYDERPRHGLDQRHRHRPARPLAAARGRRTAARRSTLRLSYQAAGRRCSGAITDRLSAAQVQRQPRARRSSI